MEPVAKMVKKEKRAMLVPTASMVEKKVDLETKVRCVFLFLFFCSCFLCLTSPILLLPIATYETGPVGEQGLQGLQGIKGIQGDQGVKGEIGGKGIKGDQGAKGKNGTNGRPGQDGTVQSSADTIDNNSTNEYVVKHSITLSGIDADTFNTNTKLLDSFTETVMQLLDVSTHNIRNVRAIATTKSGTNVRRFLSSPDVSCHVLYELVFDSKTRANAIEHKIEQPDGLFQNNVIFMSAFKSKMKRKNVDISVANSITTATPAATASMSGEKETDAKAVNDGGSTPTNELGNAVALDFMFILSVLAVILASIAICVAVFACKRRKETGTGTSATPGMTLLSTNSGNPQKQRRLSSRELMSQVKSKPKKQRRLSSRELMKVKTNNTTLDEIGIEMTEFGFSSDGRVFSNPNNEVFSNPMRKAAAGSGRRRHSFTSLSTFEQKTVKTKGGGGGDEMEQKMKKMELKLEEQNRQSDKQIKEQYRQIKEQSKEIKQTKQTKEQHGREIEQLKEQFKLFVAASQNATINQDDAEVDEWEEHKTEEGLSQWEKPSGGNDLEARSPSAADSPQHHARMSTKLPSNWNKRVDPQGKRYYSNTETRETSWTAPDGATGGSSGVDSTE